MFLHLLQRYFEILGMHFTNELCNHCASCTFLRNYITQKLRNIRSHYAYNTQSPNMQINCAIYTDIAQALRRHYHDGGSIKTAWTKGEISFSLLFF